MNGSPVPLFFRSYYSFMESCLSLEDIVRTAKRLNIRDVILADINGLYGMLFFQQMCLDNGLRPVTACCLKYRGDKVYAVVRNSEGYRNLCNIISIIHKGEHEKLADIILSLPGGLVFFSGQKDILGVLTANDSCETYPLLFVKKDWRSRLANLQDIGLPVFIAGDICCLNDPDMETLKLLRAIKDNTSIYKAELDEDSVSFSRYTSFAGMLDMGWPVSDPGIITRDIDFLYHQGMVFISSSGSAEKLKALVYSNISRRYRNPGVAVYSRIEKELSLIISKGFCDYFLTVHDIVKNRDYYCGRGSAAASIVAYLLFITDIDPVKHNLYFERFLNEAREDPPDIDIDFPWDERDDVLEYIFSRYSEKNCALVSNVISFKDRMAVRETAKVFGMPGDIITQKTRKITYLSSREEIRKDFSDIRWNNILKYAERIRGIPRHLSVHCGGIIITPPRIFDYVPVEMAKKGMPIIQWEKDQAEMGGLVKIDILGNRTLAVIRDTISNLRDVKGIDYEYKTLDVTEDENIKKSFAQGDTIGVFYLESPAIRALQKKVKSGEFEDITIHSSIIRPAANRYINDYIERRMGAPYQSVHPALKEVLSETCEIMVYQEDIEKVCIKLLDFSVRDSALLRKSLSSKAGKKEYWAGIFLERGLEKKIERGILDKVWSMIDSFSGYSFNKPHSASYVMVSFKSGFFKTYYPAFFYASVIENRGGYYRTDTYINQAKRLGINVLKPSVNYTRKQATAMNDNNIMLGWSFIKGIEKMTIEKILEANNSSLFENFRDFYIRMHALLDHSQILMLIFAGTFNEFEDFQNVLGLLMQYLRMKSRQPCEAAEGKHKISDRKILFLEQKHYGFSLSRNPAGFVRGLLKDSYEFSDRIPEHVNREISLLGYYVTAKLTSTRHDRAMAFFSFEDEKGIYDTILFPPGYAEFKEYLFSTDLFVIKGIVREHYGTYSIDVSDITPIIVS